MALGILADVLLIAFLVYQTYLGWRSGFLWQVAGLAAVGFGVIVGAALAPSLGGRLLGVVTSNPFHAKLTAFLLAGGLVCFAFRLVVVYAEARSEEGISKKEREIRRREDRILGSIFGALKGSVLTLVFLAGLAGFSPDNTIWEESQLAPPLASAGMRLLPSGMARSMQAWLDESKVAVCEGLQIRSHDDRANGKPRRRATSEEPAH